MLRPATDADVPAIVALMNQAYRRPGTAADWSTEAAYITGSRTTEALLRADLAAAPDARFLKWVAPGEEALSGCVWVEPRGDGTWYLGSLAVAPARQDAGRGTAVLAAAEAWIAAAGGTRVVMNVIQLRTALIDWYARRGYRPTGEIEAFPYGDDRFGTPLRDDLHFVVLAKSLAA